MGVVSRIKQKLFQQSREREICFYNDIKEKFSWNGRLLSVGSFVRQSVRMYPQCIALIGKGKTVTYRELYIHALDVAKKLSELGVKKNDKVLLYCENSIEFYIFYYAIWLRGAIAIPVNIFLHEKELAHIMKDSQPSAALVLSRLKGKLELLFENGLIKALPEMITEQVIDWKKVLPQKMDEIDDPFINESSEPDELALLLYTSGTTGVPKGVMLSSKNILTNAMQDYARLRLFSNERERFLAILPLFHVFAQNTCMWLPLLTGSSVVVVPRIDRRYILEGLRKKPTLFFGFPALYGLLCLMKTAPLSTIKRFVSGADAMPDKIRAAFAMIYGRKICSGYGLTEASERLIVERLKKMDLIPAETYL